MCEIVKQELEELTGKVIKGDITPILFDLIAESEYLGDLFYELSGTELTSEEVAVRTESKTVDFDSWFNQCPIIGV